MKTFKNLRRSIAAQWFGLIMLTGLITFTLDFNHMPGNWLIGPMLAAVVIALSLGSVHIHDALFIAAQGMVGCLIALGIPGSIATTLSVHAGALIAGILGVYVSATLLGWLLTRRGDFPGNTALLGSTPGAASVMTVLAESYGADARLVAFMQYLRVACVTLVTAMVAHYWVQTQTLTAHPIQTSSSLLGPVRHWDALVLTLSIALGGAYLGARLRLPAGALLLPLFASVLVQNVGDISLELHPLVLAVTYTCIGWAIGIRFDRQVVSLCIATLPQIIGSTLALIALCAATGAALAHFAGIDPLTAYLATSPGGADVVAILAASIPVDVTFVVAMQVLRVLFVMATGPAIVKLLSRNEVNRVTPRS